MQPQPARLRQSRKRGTYRFTLAEGARTKVTKNSGGSGHAGDWTFDCAPINYGPNQ